MRVNKYSVELDNGNAITIVGVTSEAAARRLAEEAIQRGSDKKCASASSVESIRLVERGRWG